MRSTRALPDCNSLTDGTVSTGSDVEAASPIARRRSAAVDPGSAVMMCVAPAVMRGSITSPKVPSTGAPEIRAPRLAGSSSSRPSTVQPCCGSPATSNRAASPAPITMARRTSPCPPVIWAFACS